MTTPTLPQLLAECRELDAKATKGPWESTQDKAAVLYVRGQQGTVAVLGSSRLPKNEADAAFIAHARTAMPLLVERLEAAEHLVDIYRLCVGVPVDSLRRALGGESDE